MQLSITLPCYNEAPSLTSLIDGYREASRNARLGPSDFELILVDNGSSDDTATVLKSACARPGNEFLRAVSLKPNRGYGGGVLAGLAASRGEILAFSHADEQCAPSDVFAAFAQSRTTPKRLIKGRRLGRRLGQRLFSFCFALVALVLLRRRLSEINAQPKLFPRDLLDHLKVSPPADFAFDLHVLLRAKEAGLTIHEIPVAFPDRRHGESKWAASFRSRLRQSLALVRFMSRYRPAEPR